MVTVRDATDADRGAISALHVAAIRELGPAAYDDRVVDAWAGGSEARSTSGDRDASASDDEDRDPAGYPIGETDAAFVVAEVDGRVAGFGDVTGVDPNDYDVVAEERADATGEVRAVYVHPDFARRGVGSALLAELERRARDRGFETLVLTASLNAVPFYERRGYAAVTTVTHEFGGEVPGDAVVMRRSL